MNILLVTDAYPPEIRSSSHLMFELAEELRDRGHGVFVLTCWPQYHLDERSQSNTFKTLTNEDGIHVVRVKTLPHHKINFLVRGIAQLLLPLQFRWALRRHVNHQIDGVIVYSPPLPLAFVGEMLHQQEVHYILNIQDVFPQNAIDLGVLKNPVLIAFFRWMERRAYRWADIVTVHSEGNKLLQIAANPELASKFAVLPNWIDVEYYAGQKGSRDFRREWEIEGRFIALFAGVIGPSQNLDVLLDVAARLRDIPELLFLVVGDGSEKRRIEERIRREGHVNIMLKPLVSRADYPFLARSADVGIVTLSSQNKTPVVPGKILGYMASGKPIAAFLNKESDGHALVREAMCGFTCMSDQLDEIERIMRLLHADQTSAAVLGARGLSYVRQHFAKSAIVDQFERWLGSKQREKTNYRVQ